MPKAGTKQYQADVEAIAAASESLAELLERHQQEIDFARGSPLTFHHVEVRSRTIRQELAGEVAAPDGWSYAGLDDATRPPPALPDFLRALAQELRPLRVPRDTIIRPTRVAGETAERTFMVRSLSEFLHKAFGTPRAPGAGDDQSTAHAVQRTVFGENVRGTFVLRAKNADFDPLPGAWK